MSVPVAGWLGMLRLEHLFALQAINGALTVVSTAAVPIGAALGGLIADAFGLRATVTVAALGTIVATFPLVRSPLWG